jgi:hypothetical protein
MLSLASCRWTVRILFMVVFAAASINAAKFAGDAFSLGVGGRSLAMGGAAIAGPFDGSAGYWNPAGMTSLNGRNVLAMHAETFGSLLNHDFVSYVDSRPREGSSVQAFGFYLYYLGGGGIKITSLNEFDRPVVVREESHGDFLFAAAISGRLTDKIDFGGTAKVISRDIGTESGKGLAMDVGFIYRFRPSVTFGLMLSDITTGFIRYSGGSVIEDGDSTFVTSSNSESIYPTVKPGVTLSRTFQDFTGRLAVSGDVKFENIKTGAQYWSGPVSLDTHFGLEIGYRGVAFARSGFDIGRFTVGGGINVRKITVDFAYFHQSELDETLRVSAGYQF